MIFTVKTKQRAHCCVHACHLHGTLSGERCIRDLDPEILSEDKTYLKGYKEGCERNKLN